jgi:hypothetical protein
MSGLLDSVLSTPMRLYLDSVLSRKKDPITESDFTPEELAAVRQMVERQKASQGGITYADYAASDQPGVSSLLSPAGRVANSLGQFNYQNDPEGTTVTDNYDFNPTYKDLPLAEQIANFLGTAGFSGLHTIGENVLPPGAGRTVKIRLPRR